MRILLPGENDAPGGAELIDHALRLPIRPDEDIHDLPFPGSLRRKGNGDLGADGKEHPQAQQQAAPESNFTHGFAFLYWRR